MKESSIKQYIKEMYIMHVENNLICLLKLFLFTNYNIITHKKTIIIINLAYI